MATHGQLGLPVPWPPRQVVVVVAAEEVVVVAGTVVVVVGGAEVVVDPGLVVVVAVVVAVVTVFPVVLLVVTPDVVVLVGVDVVGAAGVGCGVSTEGDVGGEPSMVIDPGELGIVSGGGNAGNNPSGSVIVSIPALKTSLVKLRPPTSTAIVLVVGSAADPATTGAGRSDTRPARVSSGPPMTHINPARVPSMSTTDETSTRRLGTTSPARERVPTDKRLVCTLPSARRRATSSASSSGLSRTRGSGSGNTASFPHCGDGGPRSEAFAMTKGLTANPGLLPPNFCW